MSANPKVDNFPELNKPPCTDLVVGIRIVRVTGEDPVGIYGAEPGSHRSVNAHYPCSGSGICQIVHCEGKILTGIPSSPGAVAGNVPVDVRIGDCFTVQEQETPPRENAILSPAITIFVCLADHIGIDRFTTQGAVPY